MNELYTKLKCMCNKQLYFTVMESSGSQGVSRGSSNKVFYKFRNGVFIINDGGSTYEFSEKNLKDKEFIKDIQIFKIYSICHSCGLRIFFYPQKDKTIYEIKYNSKNESVYITNESDQIEVIINKSSINIPEIPIDKLLCKLGVLMELN